jgi:hypothetical protein
MFGAIPDRESAFPNRYKREDLAMTEKNYLLISAAIFAIVALLHLIRLFAHWSIQVGTMTFPFWGSWLALILTVALSIWAFRLVFQWTSSH